MMYTLVRYHGGVNLQFARCFKMYACTCLMRDCDHCEVRFNLLNLMVKDVFMNPDLIFIKRNRSKISCNS